MLVIALFPQAPPAVSVEHGIFTPCPAMCAVKQLLGPSPGQDDVMPGSSLGINSGSFERKGAVERTTSCLGI